MKVCMSVIGQKVPRRSTKLKPRVVIFRPHERYRCVFTIRGQSGCVLSLSPQANNTDDMLVNVVADTVPTEAINQVTFVAIDRCSAELHSKLARIFPRLQMITLDPIHLVIAYEYASARKRTPGSSLLRSIMRRFCTSPPR